MDNLIIGTRGSQLALAQTTMMADVIRAPSPDVRTEIRVLKTKGDRITDVPLSSFAGEGVFVKELERALLEGEIDLAVHSLKDMPTTESERLTIAAIPERADARDALISTNGSRFADLPINAKIGTSSLRRRGQLKWKRPDLEMVDLRGNLDTRLRKLEETNLDAIILAAAGLERLGWQDRITERLDRDVILPAVGQGALALQVRQDSDVSSLISCLDDPRTRSAVTAERSFLRNLGGGCQTPVGGWAQVEQEQLHLEGVVASDDGTNVFRDQVSGPTEDADNLGAELADMMRQHMNACS